MKFKLGMRVSKYNIKHREGCTILAYVGLKSEPNLILNHQYLIILSWTLRLWFTFSEVNIAPAFSLPLFSKKFNFPFSQHLFPQKFNFPFSQHLFSQKFNFPFSQPLFSQKFSFPFSQTSIAKNKSTLKMINRCMSPYSTHALVAYVPLSCMDHSLHNEQTLLIPLNMMLISTQKLQCQTIRQTWEILYLKKLLIFLAYLRVTVWKIFSNCPFKKSKNS